MQKINTDDSKAETIWALCVAAACVVLVVGAVCALAFGLPYFARLGWELAGTGAL